MEDNSLVECMILFYVDKKSSLSTRQLDENTFIHQMINHIKENGILHYSDEEINRTWKKLLSKYSELKLFGSIDEKNNWKYFDILDSCYEQSDFHTNKFSVDMTWFLIECFLRRKSSLRNNKRYSIEEIHKEFVDCGYSHITKNDIKNKWRYLNLKYNKIKNDPESLSKQPHLQALKKFEDDSRVAVENMVFTKSLTEILIETYTEKKVSCIIHGYDSNLVLVAIQSKFEDLGFYFSKEDIKKQWKKLVTIYKFIKDRSQYVTSWHHYKAMENHYQNDFLGAQGKNDFNENIVKPKILRTRSKSLYNSCDGDDTQHLENRRFLRSSSKSLCSIERESTVALGIENGTPPLPQQKLKEDDKHANVDIITKINQEDLNLLHNVHKQNIDYRSDHNQTRAKSVPLYLVNGNLTDTENIHPAPSKVGLNNTCDYSPITTNEIDTEHTPRRLRSRSKSTCMVTDLVVKLEPLQQQAQQAEIIHVSERKSSKRPYIACEKKDSKIHIAKVNRAETSQTSGQLTIDLPSAAKQFSENEFLPFKKRLRMDHADFHLSTSKKLEETKNDLVVTRNGKFLSQEEMSAIMQRVDQEKLESLKACLKRIEKSNDNCVKVSEKEKMEDNSKFINTEMETNESVESLENVCSSNTENKTNINVSADQTEKSNKDCSDPNPEGKTVTYNKDKNVFHKELNTTEKTFNSTAKIADDVVDSTTMTIIDHNFTRRTLDNAASNLFNNNHQKPENYDCSNVCTTSQIATSKVDITVPYALSTKKSNEASSTESNKKTQPATLQNNGKVKLPVNVGGKLKEIFISPAELSKITIAKQKTSGNVNITSNSSVSKPAMKRTIPNFKFTSPVIRPATAVKTLADNVKVGNHTTVQLQDEQRNSASTRTQGPKDFGLSKSARNEEFETESVISEAGCDDDGLRDNLLATVIDFQEQNNQEFVEIKNLMKQNNLLQRETNRLLRLMLEKY